MGFYRSIRSESIKVNVGLWVKNHKVVSIYCLLDFLGRFTNFAGCQSCVATFFNTKVDASSRSLGWSIIKNDI